MAGHAQLKFVMTECSKTQIRLTRPIFVIKIMKEAVMHRYMEHVYDSSGTNERMSRHWRRIWLGYQIHYISNVQWKGDISRYSSSLGEI